MRVKFCYAGSTIARSYPGITAMVSFKTGHYTDYTPDYFTETKCTTCWFGCRGETQAPVLSKAKELISI